MSCVKTHHKLEVPKPGDNLDALVLRPEAREPQVRAALEPFMNAEGLKLIHDQVEAIIRAAVKKKYAGVAANDMDDIVQEAWLKVFRNIGRFNPTLVASTWITTVAVNTVNDWWRGRTRICDGIRIPRETPMDPIDMATASPFKSYSTDDSRPQLDEEQWAHLWDELARQPNGQESVQILRLKARGYTLEQMASDMKLKPGTLKNHYNRALKAARTILAEVR